jgi:hypothetical protein
MSNSLQFCAPGVHHLIMAAKKGNSNLVVRGQLWQTSQQWYYTAHLSNDSLSNTLVGDAIARLLARPTDLYTARSVAEMFVQDLTARCKLMIRDLTDLTDDRHRVNDKPEGHYLFLMATAGPVQNLVTV